MNNQLIEAYNKIKESFNQNQEINLDLITKLSPEEQKELLEYQDEQGNNLLTYALINKNFTIAKQLVEQKYGIDNINKDGLTPLIIVTYYNEFELIEKILGQKPNTINQQENNTKRTALMIAMDNGDIKQIKSFLDTDQIILNLQDNYGDTALHIAAHMGRNDLVELLINKGANPDIKNKDDKKPLLMALEENPRIDEDIKKDLSKQLEEYTQQETKDPNDLIGENFYSTEIKNKQHNIKQILEVVSERTETIITLLKKTNLTNEENETVLYKLVEYNLHEVIKFVTPNCSYESKNKALKIALNQPDSKDKQKILGILQEIGAGNKKLGEDLLELVAEQDLDIEKIKKLIKDGANLNLKTDDSMQNTALQISTYNNDTDIAKLLINNGADVHQENAFRATALSIALLFSNNDIAKHLIENGSDVNTKDINNLPMLHLAIQKSNNEIVKQIIDKGADVNEKNRKQETAIHIAAVFSNTEIFKHLIKNGANVNEKNKDQETALHIAVEMGNDKVAKYLVDNGLINVNDKDNRGYTALHITARLNNTKMAQYLIDNGADVNEKDNNGYTALNIATEKENNEIADILKQNQDNTKLKEKKSKNTNLNTVTKEVGKNLTESGLKISEASNSNIARNTINKEKSPVNKNNNHNR